MTWSTGLCGCTEDWSSCCMTCFCPCVTFGRVAEHADGGKTSCCAQGTLYTIFCAVGVPCFYSCIYRTKLRAKYNLPAKPCPDCCVHWCCECCALSQEQREINKRMSNTVSGWTNTVMAAPRAVGRMFK